MEEAGRLLLEGGRREAEAAWTGDGCGEGLRRRCCCCCSVAACCGAGWRPGARGGRALQQVALGCGSAAMLCLRMDVDEALWYSSACLHRGAKRVLGRAGRVLRDLRCTKGACALFLCSGDSTCESNMLTHTLSSAESPKRTPQRVPSNGYARAHQNLCFPRRGARWRREGGTGVGCRLSLAALAREGRSTDLHFLRFLAPPATTFPLLRMPMTVAARTRAQSQ